MSGTGQGHGGKERYGEQLGFQQSLLAEDAVSLEVRVHLRREDPYAVASYTLVREDGSWLACEVEACRAGAEDLRATVAELTETGLRRAEECLGPF